MVKNQQDQAPAARVSRHRKILRDFESDLIRIGASTAITLGRGSGGYGGDNPGISRWLEGAFSRGPGVNQTIEALTRELKLDALLRLWREKRGEVTSPRICRVISSSSLGRRPKTSNRLRRSNLPKICSGRLGWRLGRDRLPPCQSRNKPSKWLVGEIRPRVEKLAGSPCGRGVGLSGGRQSCDRRDIHWWLSVGWPENGSKCHARQKPNDFQSMN
jgi:hypothetical protein